MKIVPIFAQRLWAVHYDGETDNEYDRLMTLWIDPSWLKSFLETNRQDLPDGKTVSDMTRILYADSEAIDDALLSLEENQDLPLPLLFKNLDNNEFQHRHLSKQKARKNYLRLYAIRIDNGCFVITGGAIKLTQYMDQRPHTKRELEKLEFVRSWLQDRDISDTDSFFEFLTDPTYDE